MAYKLNMRYLKGFLLLIVALTVLLAVGSIPYKAWVNTRLLESVQESQEDQRIVEVKKWIKLGADVNYFLPDSSLAKNHSTPLYRASFLGHFDICRLLIRKGADWKSMEGVLLCNASHFGNIEEVEYYLSLGVNPNESDRLLWPNGESFGGAGYLPLGMAARRGYFEICDKLIEAGADVNATVKGCNETPLHNVSRADAVEGMKYLIKAGANIDARNTLRNETVFDVAGPKCKDFLKALFEKRRKVEQVSPAEAGQ